MPSSGQSYTTAPTESPLLIQRCQITQLLEKIDFLHAKAETLYREWKEMQLVGDMHPTTGLPLKRPDVWDTLRQADALHIELRKILLSLEPADR